MVVVVAASVVAAVVVIVNKSTGLRVVGSKTNSTDSTFLLCLKKLAFLSVESWEPPLFLWLAKIFDLTLGF